MMPAMYSSGLLEAIRQQVEARLSGVDSLAEPHFGRLACLVVDQNMPRLTGLEMIESLSGRCVNIRVLLITELRGAEIERRAASPGPTTMLKKAMPHHELLRPIAVSVG
jgi:FixJ family two-component response regulator